MAAFCLFWGRKGRSCHRHFDDHSHGGNFGLALRHASHKHNKRPQQQQQQGLRSVVRSKRLGPEHGNAGHRGAVSGPAFLLIQSRRGSLGQRQDYIEPRNRASCPT